MNLLQSFLKSLWNYIMGFIFKQRQLEFRRKLNMENEIYVNIKAELKAKPQKLTNLHQWLFVAVNTAKSIIDNTSKSNIY